ncbi:LytTR family DNA-binding domain-containing protein [Kyrpidia sp.]|uniref:LytR/AlgR family response regulator transcription factor n=1 Tax=Kyrpidia sp. TaxID=2073077 RepID=UPI00258757CA|nr:LytTR family DNA-binding domain-containing protein [Kyrpidia sp.]MCL6575584.1 LytTR family DNA-binding domain-containing protein [Kyrpidia sp.]
MKVMVAEDERVAREELTYLLSCHPDVTLCPGAENGSELLELVDQYHPDVVFLDIHMPSLSGIEAARRWRNGSWKGRAPQVVFVTAYEQYAVEAFGLDAVDYLLKPYDEERLGETLERIRRRLAFRGRDGGGHAVGTGTVPGIVRAGGDTAGQERGGEGAAKGLLTSAVPGGGGFRRPKLLVDDGEKTVVLHPGAVQYAVRNGRAVEIHTDSLTVSAKWTLAELEERLAGLNFFRTHRSYLVNLEYVSAIEPWFNGAYTVILNDRARTKIPVSRNAVKELFERLGGRRSS